MPLLPSPDTFILSAKIVSSRPSSAASNSCWPILLRNSSSFRRSKATVCGKHPNVSDSKHMDFDKTGWEISLYKAIYQTVWNIAKTYEYQTPVNVTSPEVIFQHLFPWISPFPPLKTCKISLSLMMSSSRPLATEAVRVSRAFNRRSSALQVGCLVGNLKREPGENKRIEENNNSIYNKWIYSIW